MKLKAEMGAWSSVVGGGVLLIAEDGRMAGQIAFLCHDDALRDKATQEQLARLCCDAINGTRAPLSPAVLAELPEVRALVEAETERCAKIARGMNNGETAKAIAAAIREGRA